MAADPTKIFAVLVGIDDYSSDSITSLNGCVNDVNLIKEFLESFGVPPKQINLLIAPHGSKPTPLPTKTNVVDLVRKVGDEAAKASPQSVVLFFYSGHGSQGPTKYPDIKKGATKDESICTLGGFLSDVEMVNLLEELTDKKKLTVLVVLDSCHSGGSDRDGSDRVVRCVPSQEVESSSADRDTRNSGIQTSYLYRDRKHNMIAACQPHELATEDYVDEKKTRKQGALTLYLVKTLRALRESKDPVTYERLQESLDAAIKLKFPDQQPMLLGDRNRLVFGTGDSRDKSIGIHAGIIQIEKPNIVINKGAAHGVCLNDRFWIYPPSQTLFGLITAKARPAAEAVISGVKSFQSVATLFEDPKAAGTGATSDAIAVGWVAHITKVGTVPAVNLKLETPFTGTVLAAVDQFKKDWRTLVDGPVGPPVNLHSSPNAADAILSMTVHKDGTILFQDRKGAVMANLPSLSVGDQKLVPKLAYLLPHLCAFRKLAELAPQPGSWSPSYKLNIPNLPKSTAGALPGRRIEFENLGDKPVYVTILDLSPAYGVSQIYPEQEGSAAEVDVGGKLSPNIDMSPPDLLKAASVRSGFKMTDIFKVIIASEETNFSHYILPDIQSWEEWSKPVKLDGPEMSSRNAAVAKPSEVEGFFVDDREIITEL